MGSCKISPEGFLNFSRMEEEKSIEETNVKDTPETEPTAGTSSRETHIRSRSVSLNRILPEKSDSPEDTLLKKRDTYKRKRDSPPPKDVVKTKRMIYEEKLAQKYKAQHSAKELAREKCKGKKEKGKNKSEDEDQSIAAMLSEMRADIREIKTDNKDIKTNMQQMSTKIVAMENKQRENEQKIATEFIDIRKEIQTNKENMQDSIAANVIEKLKPVIEEKSSNKVNTEEVVKIIEEILAKRLPPAVKASEEVEHSEDSDLETGEPEKKKKKNLK